MRTALLVAVLMVLAADASADSLAWAHARPTSSHAAQFLQMATQRSALVRVLLDDLERTDVVAYLVFSREVVPQQTRDYLSFLTHAGGTRYVVITIYSRQQPPIAYVPAFAHELQHALEVARAAEVHDGPTFGQLFGTIGWQTETGGFETARARNTEELVREELARNAGGRQ